MTILLILVECAVLGMASWVVVFEVGLYLQTPIAVLGSVELIVVVALIGVMARPWWRRLRGTVPRDWRVARDVLIFGSLIGVLVLGTSRPDTDDVGFILQPMIDAETPDQPFTAAPFVFPFRQERIEVPFVFQNEAYESLVVTVSHRFGLDPLQVYYNVFAFLAAVFWAVVYALLYLRFRVPARGVWLAILLTVVFLLFDGNLHRTFGNLSLFRLWQGKIIAWSIAMPALTLLSLRFLARPTWYRYLLVMATVVSSFFVSRSCSFMVPVAVGAICLTYPLAFGIKRRRLSRAFMLATVMVPVGLVGFALALYSLPSSASVTSLVADLGASAKNADPTAYLRGFGRTWSETLYLAVIGRPAILIRDVFLLFVLPFTVMPRPLNRFLPWLSLMVGFLAMSPLTGPVWQSLVSAAYWRMYLILPLPLCVGMAVFLMAPSRRSWCRRRVARIGFAAAVVTVTGVAVVRPALSTLNGVSFKLPWQYRLPAEGLEFSNRAAPLLKGRLVAAPNEVSTVLALTRYQSVDLVYAKTRAGAGDIGRTNRVLTTCSVTPKRAQSVEAVLARGVEAVVIADCTEERLARLRRFLPDYRLDEVEDAATENFRLFWVSPSSDAAGAS